MKKNLFWILSIGIVIYSLFSVHKFDSRYGRSINGDGKAYYSYLPAIFIYQDPTFSFIESVEDKYYPIDRSQFKDFLNKQKNGKFVNKTFPGLSILYAPFFFVSMLLAWISGYAVDGYSAPFQWGIAFAHVVYFFIGFRFLLSFFRSQKIKDSTSYLMFCIILFGTNCWFYLVYDHSVSHIFNFFLASVFLWTMSNWLSTKRSSYLGFSGLILCLLVVTRPTNGLMLLFFPLIVNLNGLKLNMVFNKDYFRFKALLPYISIAILIMAIPLLLWKWQSDLWIVYSYNEEGFNFANPQFFNFLFSYEKGWFLWSPLTFLMVVSSSYFFLKRSFFSLLTYLLPIGLVVYVLSSWWCWTYGGGFGQRPMLEFIPFICIGAVMFLNQFKYKRSTYLIVISFCFLSMFQGYQIANSVLIGGTTTQSEYWSHFLQWKMDAPSVKIDPSWELVENKTLVEMHKLDREHPFSQSIKTSVNDSIRKLVVCVEIGTNKKEEDLRIVVTSSDGNFYKDIYLTEYLGSEIVKMEFEVDVSSEKNQSYTYYLWNGDSSVEASILFMGINCYR